MNSRSRKYHDSRKANQNSKKGSASNAGYDEQNEKTIKAPKENPAVPKKKAVKTTTAEQDDTGGPNNSGKRSDDE